MDLIRYDNNGNIYLLKNDELYTFDITKDDELELYKINKQNIKFNQDISDYKNIDYKPIFKQNILHIKSIENAINELTQEDNEDEKDKFNDIYDKYNTYLYNPEQRYYHEQNDDIKDDEYFKDDEDDEYDSTFDKRKIKFFGNINNNLIHDICFDIPTYEILIIDGNEFSNNLVFRTELINDHALYRITIFTIGIILFNIIGSHINKYSINILTDNIMINKIETTNIKVN